MESTAWSLGLFGAGVTNYLFPSRFFPSRLPPCPPPLLPTAPTPDFEDRKQTDPKKDKDLRTKHLCSLSFPEIPLTPPPSQIMLIGQCCRGCGLSLHHIASFPPLWPPPSPILSPQLQLLPSPHSHPPSFFSVPFWGLWRLGKGISGRGNCQIPCA